MPLSQPVSSSAATRALTMLRPSLSGTAGVSARAGKDQRKRRSQSQSQHPCGVLFVTHVRPPRVVDQPFCLRQITIAKHVPPRAAKCHEGRIPAIPLTSLCHVQSWAGMLRQNDRSSLAVPCHFDNGSANVRQNGGIELLLGRGAECFSFGRCVSITSAETIRNGSPLDGWPVNIAISRPKIPTDSVIAIPEYPRRKREPGQLCNGQCRRIIGSNRLLEQLARQHIRHRHRAERNHRKRHLHRRQRCKLRPFATCFATVYAITA